MAKPKVSRVLDVAFVVHTDAKVSDIKRALKCLSDSPDLSECEFKIKGSIEIHEQSSGI